MTLITFPVIRATKMPAIKWGNLQGPAEVPPGFDTGIATGAKSGIVVLDLDEKEGRQGIQNLAKVLGVHDAPPGLAALGVLIQRGILPYTPTVRTRSGGLHLYFAHPGQRVPNSAGAIGVGIDVRGDGGYVVAPPSPGYDVLYTQEEPAPCPPWIRTHAQVAALPATHSLLREDFESLAGTLKRDRAETRKMLGRALKLAADGTAFAQPGQVDVTLWTLVLEIAEAFPMATPESIAEFFLPSLQLMATDSRGVDPAYVIEKVERARVLVAERKAAPEIKQAEQQSIRLAQVKRTHAYTADELARWQHLPWLIQRGKSFWVLFEGEYQGPFIREEMGPVCAELLSPAPVELWNDEGAFKGIERLMIECGQFVKEHHLSYVAQTTHIEDKRLIQAIAPRRSVQPRFDPQIDEWLQLAFGASYNSVCKWLAHLTELEYPAAALVITGKASAGKTLFARLCATVWDRSFVSLQDAMGTFNDALIKSPLVFADEQLPRDFRGYTRSGELREFIQAVTRPYRKKFHDTSEIVGAVRVIVAANNLDIFQSNEKLTAHDVEAIGMRFYHVEVNPDSVTYLESAPVEAMLSNFAAHVAYLESLHDRTQRRKRFLISSNKNTIARRLAVGTGIRSDVCQLLVSYLMNPDPYEATGDLHIRVHTGQLLANSRGLIDAWRTYVKQDALRQPPRTDQIATALRGLSLPHVKKTHRDKRGHMMCYRVIDVEMLKAWAEETEYIQPEAIDVALSVDTEARRKALTH